MCGISGFVDTNNHSSEFILRQMCDSLVHRGPDGSGIFFKQEEKFQVGLGHRRLSIIDLSETGSQPMQTGDLFITFNGEIYNYKEIRTELEDLGHNFKSHSDTEVILAAYRQWKENCLKRFIGMFAFVIFDSANKEFFCARDRAGVKPFFYHYHEGLFMFASELKAFHCHPHFKKILDERAMKSFFAFGNIPGQWCIFKNCHKLPPAHFMKFKAGKDPEVHAYWNVYDSYNQRKLDISFEEARAETEKLISSAAAYRMVADVPVGVFLSGGYDSTCITALLQKNSATQLKTFTIGVEDMGLNEAPYAKKIAEHLGTSHEEYYCTHQDAMDLIPSLPAFYDEPFADQSAIPTTLVSRIAKKQVKVALSADGGDEVFAGYNRYGFMMKEGKLLRQTPALLRKAILSLMKNIPAEKIPVLRNQYNFHYRYEKSKLLLSDPSPENIMLRLSKQFTDTELDSLFYQTQNDLHTQYESKELRTEFFTPLSYMMAIDYQTYLVDDILQKVDRASMSQSLEAREPFLDHRLIEWAAKLPDHYKYHKHQKKYILKEIVHNYVPKHLMERPKMGFAVPVDQWLLGELKERVMHYLDESVIKEQGLLRSEIVLQLKKQFYSGKRELATRIWYLLMFSMWHEKWMRRSQAV